MRVEPSKLAFAEFTDVWLLFVMLAGTACVACDAGLVALLWLEVAIWGLLLIFRLDCHRTIPATSTADESTIMNTSDLAITVSIP